MSNLFEIVLEIAMYKMLIALSLIFSLNATFDDNFDDPVLPFYDHPQHFYRAPAQPHVSYIIRFRFPAAVKNIPPLCGYYKGFRLNFNSDYCIINEKIPLDSFTLVVTDGVSRRWQNNTIQGVKRVGKKYKMFYLTKKQGTKGYSWHVEEEDKRNIPVVLPKTAIIIVFDPDLISSLKKDDDLMKVKTTAQTPLYLPIIEINSDVTEASLSNACTQASCAALDTRGIHSPVASTVKNDTSMVVTMNSLQR